MLKQIALYMLACLTAFLAVFPINGMGLLLHPGYFKGAEENLTQVEYLIFLQQEKWEDGKIAPEVDLYIILANANGEIKFERKAVVKANKTKGYFYLPYFVSTQLKPGNYTLYIGAKAANPLDSVKAELPVSIPKFSDNQAAISSFYFLKDSPKQSKATDKPIHSGVSLNILPNAVFTKEQNAIEIYAELYAGNGLIGKQAKAYRVGVSKEKEDILPEFGITRKLKENITPIIDKINIEKLPGGVYEFKVELLDETGNIIAKEQQTFTRINKVELDTNSTADYVSKGAVRTYLTGTFVENMSKEDVIKYLVALQPIASNQENGSIRLLKGTDNLKAQKEFLYNFWKKRSPSDPGIEFEEYAKLLTYAQKNYAVQNMNVFQTDRGRVILQYGKPNQVENEVNDPNFSAMQNNQSIGYEIWTYYRTERTRQNNVIFVFVQENRGNNNYRLVHSNANGEIFYPEWRTALRKNNSEGRNNFTGQPTR